MSLKETNMHSIRLHDVHMPKGANLYALSVGKVVWFSIAVFFFLISWMVGGDDFVVSIGGSGSGSLAALMAGPVVGAILCNLTKPEK
jgi:hypothetical protein